MRVAILFIICLTFPWSRGGKITPQADLLAAISEPHGTNQNALVTFLRYGWATKWHNYGIYIFIQKSKMAAESASNFLKKFLKTYNSDCMQDNCIIPTAVPIFFRSRNSMKQLSILCGASGSQKSKMAAQKDEVLISQQVYNIAAKFQQRHPCFWGWGIQRSYFPYSVMQADIKNPRWRLTNRKYLYLSLYTT